MITVIQNADGSTTFFNFQSLTITQQDLGGLKITTPDSIVLPSDPALQAKLDLIRADIAKLANDAA